MPSSFQEAFGGRPAGVSFIPTAGTSARVGASTGSPREPARRVSTLTFSLAHVPIRRFRGALIAVQTGGLQ